jgi:hypothetical protein
LVYGPLGGWLNHAEPINGSDVFVRHASCGAAGAPSLTRINSTLREMSPIHRFFGIVLARVTVKPSTLTRSVSLFRIFMTERGFDGANSVPEETCSKLVQEAWRRTADSDPKGIARCGPFYRQLDLLADQTIAAIHGLPDTDSRIRQILEFSRAS